MTYVAAETDRGAFRVGFVAVQEYSKKLTRPPTVLSDMELVEQPVDRNAPCTCDRTAATTV